MEIEELQEQLEAVTSKNKQLLDELKKERSKTREVDMDAYRKALEENDSLKEEITKLHGESKAKAKEFEKLSMTLSEKEKAVHKLLVSDGITKELASLGIDDIETLMPFFERNATVENDVALVDGKPLKEYVSEWANGAGKRYIMTTTSTGGGSQGGSTTGGGQSDSGKFHIDSSKSDRVKAIEEKYLKG